MSFSSVYRGYERTMTIGSADLETFLSEGRFGFKLPDRIQQIFKRKISENNQKFESYSFSHTIESEKENGKEKEKTFYTMAPIIRGRAETQSPLYTQVLYEETEEIEAPPEKSPQWGFFCFLQQLMDKILQFVRNLFAQFSRS